MFILLGLNIFYIWLIKNITETYQEDRIYINNKLLDNYLVLILVIMTYIIISILLLERLTLDVWIVLSLLICLYIICKNKDLIIFVLGYEYMLLPIIILQRNGASIYIVEGLLRLYYYTMLGSIFLYILIIVYYSIFNTTNDIYVTILVLGISDKSIIYSINLICLLVFLIKLPLYPFYKWLGLAHSSSSKIGSILLASIILKMSLYGIIRYNISIYKHNYILNGWFLSIILSICLISIIISSIIPILELELKKIIAVSSINHMSFILLSLLINKYNIYYITIGLIGTIVIFIGHSYISSGIFLLVGLLNKYLNINYIYECRQLLTINKNLFLYYNLLILSNMSLPFTINFIGEFYIYYSIMNSNKYILYLIFIFILLGNIYNIKILSYLSFRLTNINIYKYIHIEKIYNLCISLLLLYTIILGININIVINIISNITLFYIL